MTDTNQATQQPSIPATRRGWVNTYYRYYKGKKLGPYYVRRWKVGKQVHKQYIKPQDVEKVKAECQAHRERRKRLSNFLHNVDFLGKMLNRYDAGKIVTPDMEAYICRIYNEGHYITGRPQMRRKVTREMVTIDGKQMFKRTVFELDGTTKVFMVPIFANCLKLSFWNAFFSRNSDRIEEFALEIWEEVHGKTSDMECGQFSSACGGDARRAEGAKGPPLSNARHMECGDPAPLSNAWLQPPGRTQFV